MLKALRMIIIPSDRFIPARSKPSGFSFYSLSVLPSPCCSSGRRSSTSAFFLIAPASTRKSYSLRAFRMSSSRSEMHQDGASSSTDSAIATQSTVNARKINYCQWCGGPTKDEIPDGEEKMRAVCTLCGKIAYQNPKMVVGCLIEHENKILLCKRKIQPSYGLWTLPAGYMEIGESAAVGAARETQEEAGADVEILSPFAQLDIPLIGQVRKSHFPCIYLIGLCKYAAFFYFLLCLEQTYIIFLAKMKTPYFSPGPESMECRLFALDDIPFDSLAFSSMLVTLKLYIEDIKAGKPKFHYGTINKRPGTSPSDIHAFTLDYHLQS